MNKNVVKHVGEDMPSDKNIALVFSGGGSRGSYQIGVWKALDEIGISGQIGAVYGTSVGAINGAAFVQGDISYALDIWQSLTYTSVFADIPAKRPSFFNRRQYMEWLRGSISNKGLDVSPLKQLIRTSLDEGSIRDSGINFGLVVFDLTQMKARYLKKEEIPDGQLIEYVIASATFPIFKPHRIENHLFLDGGVADNRPLGFIKQSSGIEHVIVVDVTMARHVWPNKKVANDIQLTYIRPSRLLGSPLSFKNERIMSNLELGYVNTLAQMKMVL